MSRKQLVSDPFFPRKIELTPISPVLHSNSPPNGALKLHLARCRFIGANGAPPPRGDVWTNYPKRCSTDRAELAQFADAHGGFDECQFCCR